jgi:hypothetical protein
MERSWKEHRHQRPQVSATQLAQMAVCEKLVVFEHRHGKRPTGLQRTVLQRGVRAHRQFLRQASTSPRGVVDLVLGQLARVAIVAGRFFVRWCRALWRRLRASRR